MGTPEDVAAENYFTPPEEVKSIMKIPEAIEIKLRYQYILQDASFPELIEADNLSIEALKAIIYLRTIDYRVQAKRLPGETPEEEVRR